jgi:hypothetical protein
MEIIRKYKESDWVHVRNIYDLSKPDEMNGIVESDKIIPLAQDEKMLQYSMNQKYGFMRRIINFQVSLV